MRHNSRFGAHKRAGYEDFLSRATDTISDRAATASKTLRSKAADAADEIRERLDNKLDDTFGIRSFVDDKLIAFKDKIKTMDMSKTRRELREFTRKHPGRALAISGGLGLAIGMLARTDLFRFKPE